MTPQQAFARLKIRASCFARGIDLSPSNNSETGVDPYDGLPHAAIGIPELLEVCDRFGLTGKIKSVLDIGSGKGAALIAFHKLGAKTLKGIELSEAMNTICRNNLERLHIKAELDVGNAASLTDFSGIDLIYIYGTLPLEPMKSFLQNLKNFSKIGSESPLLLLANPRYFIDESFLQQYGFRITSEIKTRMPYILVQRN